MIFFSFRFLRTICRENILLCIIKYAFLNNLDFLNDFNTLVSKFKLYNYAYIPIGITKSQQTLKNQSVHV